MGQGFPGFPTPSATPPWLHSHSENTLEFANYYQLIPEKIHWAWPMLVHCEIQQTPDLSGSVWPKLCLLRFHKPVRDLDIIHSTLHMKKLRHRHVMSEVTMATQTTPNFKVLRCNATLGLRVMPSSLPPTARDLNSKPGATPQS